MLAAYLSEDSTRNWVSSLPLVQAAKNRRFHSGIGRSPYEAMFGKPMSLGISDDNFPKDVLSQIESEEDLERAFNIVQQESENINESDEQSQEDYEFFTLTQAGPPYSQAEPLSLQAEPLSLHSEPLSPQAGPSSSNFFDENLNVFKESSIIDWGEVLEKINKERDGARKFQEKQAERMLNASNKR